MRETKMEMFTMWLMFGDSQLIPECVFQHSLHPTDYRLYCFTVHLFSWILNTMHFQYGRTNIQNTHRISMSKWIIRCSLELWVKWDNSLTATTLNVLPSSKIQIGAPLVWANSNANNFPLYQRQRATRHVKYIPYSKLHVEYIQREAVTTAVKVCGCTAPSTTTLLVL